MNEITERVQVMELATPRRGGRKRSIISSVAEEQLPSGFRDTLAPPEAKKKLLSSPQTDKAVIKLYTKQTIGRIARKGLETIYEDSSLPEGDFIGKPKIKRYLNVDRNVMPPTKQKKKMREKKIKRLGLSVPKRKKLSEEEFNKRLEIIQKYVSEFLKTGQGQSVLQ